MKATEQMHQNFLNIEKIELSIDKLPTEEDYRMAREKDAIDPKCNFDYRDHPNFFKIN